MAIFREEFRKGSESAKIKSPRQAILTAFLQAVVISIAIFNEFPLLIKVLLFILLQLILGGIMSSKWVQSKWKPQTQKKSRDTLIVEQFLTDELARIDPAMYHEMSMGQAFKRIAAKQKEAKNQVPKQPDDVEEEILVQALQKRCKEHFKEEL
jgi:hypothetical protein